MNIPLGIWRSSYAYPSSGRGKELTGEHVVRAHQKDNHLVFESAPETSKSYLILRLSVQDDVATGSWQEETEPDGYYKGAIYHGALQLTISGDGRSMKGKWVGFGKDGQVNTGPWQLTYIGKSLPKKILLQHAKDVD